jgi:hypothetical protein
MLHVGEETLARLLAVVADIDTGLELLANHLSRGRLDRNMQVRFIDYLAPT